MKKSGTWRVLRWMIGAVVAVLILVLLKELGGKDPLQWPWMALTLYLVLCVILFPWSEERLTTWTQGHHLSNVLSIPVVVVPLALLGASLFVLLFRDSH